MSGIEICIVDFEHCRLLVDGKEQIGANDRLDGVGSWELVIDTYLLGLCCQ